MTVNTDLIGLAQRAGRLLHLPPVTRMYLPEPDPGPDKNTEFGILALEDGSAGLYYAWLGEAQKGMNRRFPLDSITGSSPLDLVPFCLSNDEAERSLGMAAINAITQLVFRHSGYVPEPAPDSLGSLDAGAGDHIGMVGYFPSLARRLRDLGIRVTVVEKKEKFLGRDGSVEIVPDPDALRGCNKVLCTASTLLNDSIEGILDYATGADHIVIVGPTAGFFPDPLFVRGVTAMGGTAILDVNAAIDRLVKNEPLGNSVRKFLIRCTDYPGTETLFKDFNPVEKAE